MTITAAPTASYIRSESRLRPEQVNTSLADTTALEADITARIATYRAVINKKVTGVTDTLDNQTIATEALAKRVLASLYGSAGYLNHAYWERANALKAESADLIDDLLGTSADAVTAAAGAATLTTSPYVVDSVGLLVVNGPDYLPDYL